MISNSNNVVMELTELFNSVPRYNYSTFKNELQVLNGIYIQFEDGEKVGGYDRVVRIGTHVSDNRLKKRLEYHYTKTSHRDSVFRCHVGRCYLNREKDPYLSTWILKFKTKEDKERNANVVNLAYEKPIEEKITRYIQGSTTFSIIPHINSKSERSKLEEELIATFANSNTAPSQHWLGRHHPTYAAVFGRTGLWNVQGINGLPLDKNGLNRVRRMFY